MKRFIYLVGMLILLLALGVGCTNSENDPDKLDEGQVTIDEDELDLEEDEETTAEEIIKDFENKLESSLNDAGTLIEKKMEKLSEIEVDQMVLNLMNKTEENIDEIRQKIQNIDVKDELRHAFDGDLYLTQDLINNLQNDDLRKELNRLQSENYRLINLEGEYYPIVNYEGFKKYDGHVSDEVRDYIDLKARDSNKLVALDAAIYISYDELADRIVKTEDYIKKYGEGDRYGEALNMYRNKLHMYLLGTDNTPITDVGSNKIKEEVMESYKETALIRDSSTGFIVGKYINIIASNKGVIDDDVRSKGQMLLEEATELIGTGK